jgi:putative DNA primase/helicase
VRTNLIEVNDDLSVYAPEEILAEFPPEQKPHKPPFSLDGRIVLPADEPLRCAEAFLDQKYRTTDGVCRLHYYRGSFYSWRGTHCAQLDEQEVRSTLYSFLRDALTITRQGPATFKPTSAKVNSILDGLKSGVYHSRDKKAPFFITPYQDCSTDGLIACNNGLLDINTRKLAPHSPYLFNVNCLPFNYGPDAPPAGLWSRFLRQLWPDDAEARRTLQEIFGLMLTADSSHQKIF